MYQSDEYGGARMSSSGMNGVDVTIGVWLLLVGVIAVLLVSGWFLDTKKRWVCYGLAMVLAYSVSYEMKSSLGVFTWVVATWAWIGLVCMRGSGHTILTLAAMTRKRYLAWRGLGWSGEFVQPMHDRI